MSKKATRPDLPTVRLRVIEVKSPRCGFVLPGKPSHRPSTDAQMPTEGPNHGVDARRSSRVPRLLRRPVAALIDL
ncbi:hypothetical protein [Pararhodobacter sp. SW119]|uniref:hypothetical protein n=1 Tax=Pararhodobacter sp. SW119 TaxID=2780075 RepID=UPI001ADF20CE|nr:hypothetical protein [Pararhodobacter sp. SW119]